MNEDNFPKRLKVVDGHVQCPMKGPIDIDLCFYCSHMDRVELDSSNPSIGCTGTAPKTVSRKEKTVTKWLTIIEMANYSGNIAQTCRDYGVSRTLFYRYKHRFEQEGFISYAK